MTASDEIQEFVAHSYYDYAAARTVDCIPMTGRPAELQRAETAVSQLDVDQSYSWLKSPRWKGHAMEVGPLARVLMLYAKGHDQTKELVDMTLNKLDVPVAALFSTLGRTAARGLETKVIGDMMQTWYNNLVANIKAGDTQDVQRNVMGPVHLAGTGEGRRFHGSAARWAGTLDRDRRRDDQELPGRRAEHLECRAP